MPKLKLSYFDFDGGRGETIRMALSLGNVNFEDDRLNREQYLEKKGTFPYAALPVLFVDGAPLAQSNSICRYVGKLTDLYPSDPWQAALCDETLDTVEELTLQIGATMALPDEEKKQKRLKLASEVLPVFLGGLESRLKSGGGTYFANQRLTVADLKASDLIDWLRSGMLDHIPADIVDKLSPNLTKHTQTVKNDHRVKAYLEAREKKKTK